jgi:peptidoglycan-associated lipoprotein
VRAIDQQARAARGVTAGIAATYHFDPYTRLDPWLELGTGYRMLWEDARLPASNLLSHGFELARARVGIDVRVSPEVAIAPVVGADLNVFTFQDWTTSSNIADPRLSTFVFGGLQGRFDFGPSVGGASLAAAPLPSEAAMTTVTSGPWDEEPRTPPPQTMPVSPSIAVSEDLAQACSLHFSNILEAPKFEFDKTQLLPADKDVLEKIAACVSTGPLAGRELKLIGHADPRGTAKYNMALGARRANSVAGFLERRGVDARQMTQTSRGELDAIGTDEETWTLDRRVDIHLVH